MEQQEKIETMTIAELYSELSSLGVKTTPVKIRAAIAQGLYPFAICIQMKNQEFEIYRAMFERWKSERVS